MANILLSSAYLGPVEYFTCILGSEEIWIDQFENFHKQTYRNRCIIMGANGIIPLVVPVTAGRGSKTTIKDITISYDTEWQRIHWKSIFSAYGSSPFFQYYDSEIAPFYHRKKWKFLLDFNLSIQEKVLELIGITPNVIMTSGFEQVKKPYMNLREKINPFTKASGADLSFFPKKYNQVFSERFGFVPNLSIIDLLFNEGPDSLSVLQGSSSDLLQAV